MLHALTLSFELVIEAQHTVYTCGVTVTVALAVQSTLPHKAQCTTHTTHSHMRGAVPVGRPGRIAHIPRKMHGSTSLVVARRTRHIAESDMPIADTRRSR